MSGKADTLSLTMPCQIDFCGLTHPHMSPYMRLSENMLAENCHIAATAITGWVSHYLTPALPLR